MEKVETMRDYSPDFQVSIPEKKNKRPKFEFIPKNKQKTKLVEKGETLRSANIDRNIKPKRPDRSARVYKSQYNNKPLVLNEK
jgi:hypothetical protein